MPSPVKLYLFNIIIKYSICRAGKYFYFFTNTKFNNTK